MCTTFYNKEGGTNISTNQRDTIYNLLGKNIESLVTKRIMDWRTNMRRLKINLHKFTDIYVWL